MPMFLRWLNVRVHIQLAPDRIAMTQLVTHAESDRVRWRFFVCVPKVAAGLSGPYRRSQAYSIALNLLGIGSVFKLELQPPPFPR